MRSGCSDIKSGVVRRLIKCLDKKQHEGQRQVQVGIEKHGVDMKSVQKTAVEYV